VAKGDLGILPPNAGDLIGQQTQSNINTAVAQSQLNNVNQYTPWGSSVWTMNPNGWGSGSNGGGSQGGSPGGYNGSGTPGSGGGTNGIPQWSQHITLSPQQQALFDQQQGTQLNLAQTAGGHANQLRGLLSQGISNPNMIRDFGTAGPLQRDIAGGNYGANVKRVEDALYARVNPQIERDRTRLETQLANQGIRIGSDAYRKAMDDQARSVNDQRTSITLQAGQEQNRLQDLELNRANFHNSAQQQAFTQLLTRAGFSNQAAQQMLENTMGIRNQGINEQSALMNGTQVGQPQFPGTGQTGVGGVDTAGINNTRYQQMQNLWGGLLGGFGNLVGGFR
jgi:hypothetical protein